MKCGRSSDSSRYKIDNTGQGKAGTKFRVKGSGFKRVKLRFQGLAVTLGRGVHANNNSTILAVAWAMLFSGCTNQVNKVAIHM
jgi:hypothetical protein